LKFQRAEPRAAGSGGACWKRSDHNPSSTSMHVWCEISVAVVERMDYLFCTVRIYGNCQIKISNQLGTDNWEMWPAGPGGQLAVMIERHLSIHLDRVCRDWRQPTNLLNAGTVH
jgi:hypothetical protein